MDVDRRSACDRCRGQKLRCVGLANPVFDQQTGYIRNQSPCDRCRKAQVECYMARPASRRRGTDVRNPRYRQRPSASSYTSADSPLVMSPTAEPHTTRDTSSSKGLLTTLQSPDWSDLHLDDQTLGYNVDLLRHPLCLSQHNSDLVIEDFLVHGDNLSEESPTAPDMAIDAVHFDTDLGQDTVERCLQELADLNGALLHRTANRHGAPHNNTTQVHPNGAQPYSSPSPSIGDTLRYCQRFLAIIQQLQKEGLHEASDDAWLSTSRGGGMDLVVTPPNSSPDKSTKRHSRSLDTSTLFSILSCFAHVLEEYEHLFSSILDSLTQSAPTIPATLTGTTLDGFELEGNNTLQMEFLLYVSLNMLGKIEKILIGPGESTAPVPTQGLLGQKMAACAESLYVENGSSLVDGNPKKEVKARSLIRKIQAVLKTFDR